MLGGYGSGAIMAVPGHDSRDFKFAETYNLEVKRVVSGDSEEDVLPFTGKQTDSKITILFFLESMLV